MSNECNYSVICAIIGSLCNDGAVRLTNGYSNNNGFAKVCIEGEWIGICKSSFRYFDELNDIAISSCICNQLGYQRKNVVNTTYAKMPCKHNGYSGTRTSAP